MRSERPCSVAILAGGRSQRMGQDKAMYRILPNGPTLLELVIRVVTPLTDDCFIVASERPAYAETGVRVLPDLYDEAGVLGGIGSAIRHARHGHCLVVSCDHPFLNAALLTEMMDHPGSWDALIPVTEGESRQGGAIARQTLHAIYTDACIEPIERCLRAGRLRTTAFHGQIRLQELPPQWLRTCDPELWSFFSVNTTEAAAIARERLLANGG